MTPDYFKSPTGEDYGPYEGAWQYYSLDVSYDETYVIHTVSGQNARGYLVLNDIGQVILVHDEPYEVTYRNIEVKIPPSGVTLVSNYRTGDIHPFYLGKKITKIAASVDASKVLFQDSNKFLPQVISELTLEIPDNSISD